jgi:BirA family transcriptional regulator, biotin operon repressor / biotin---[acetyl-CoA-carboxylase] ligase
LAAALGSLDYERALAARGLSGALLIHRDATGSTNDDAREVDLTPPGTAGDVALVVAETQSRGRGRSGATWFSPRGSVAMTITTSGIDASALGVLPLSVGSAVARTFRELGAHAEVKWPNDVLIGGRKVCGILCESALLGASARVFIGIGINVEEDSIDPSVAARATSLFTAGVRVDRPTLVAAIVDRVLPSLRFSDAPKVVERWKEVAVPWWGDPIRVIEGDVEREVTLLDVNPRGQLIVRDASGVVRTFLSGEIRGLRSIG